MGPRHPGVDPWNSLSRSGQTRFGVSSRLEDRSRIPGLDRASGWKTIRGSPELEIDVVSGIELGCSYELGSGRTRIRVMTRPRKRLGTVMTQIHGKHRRTALTTKTGSGWCRRYNKYTSGQRLTVEISQLQGAAGSAKGEYQSSTP